jgi:hypothetical protein
LREQHVVTHDQQIATGHLPVSRRRTQVAFFSIVNHAHSATPFVENGCVDEVISGAGGERKHVSPIARVEPGCIRDLAILEPADSAVCLWREEYRTIGQRCCAGGGCSLGKVGDRAIGERQLPQLTGRKKQDCVASPVPRRKLGSLSSRQRFRWARLQRTPP